MAACRCSVRVEEVDHLEPCGQLVGKKGPVVLDGVRTAAIRSPLASQNESVRAAHLAIADWPLITRPSPPPDSASRGESPQIWRSDVLFTRNDYGRADFMAVALTEKQLADVGLAVVARLGALVRSQKSRSRPAALVTG